MSNSEIDQRVDTLYHKMSPAERLAQLQSIFMDELFDEKGHLDTAKCEQLIPNGIGHASQFAMQAPRDPNDIRDRIVQLQQWLMENTPNGIPALPHEECLSGINTMGATVYPQQIGQACSFNPDLAELKAQQTGLSMRKMGGVQSLSPMVDVCRNPSFNRLEESYGEDGYLSAVMGTAFVRGLQAGDLKHGVSACSKHYLGYGGGGDADEKEMMEDILLPHEAMIRLTGSKVLMPGYHAIHGTNCVASGEVLKDILRDYLGFDGMVVSDYTAIDQISDQPDTLHCAVAAINGGDDVDLPSGTNYALLPEAIEKGLVKPETFERAVKNVLRHKFRLGLFDKNAYLYSNEHIELDTPAERKTAYDIASQSVVLLHNNGVLPLKNTKQRILLTGPNAGSMWAMCGDYSYPSMSYFWKMVHDYGDKPHIVNLREGMTDRKPEGTELLYSRGCDWTEEVETKFQQGGDERAWEYGLLHRMVDSGEKADPDEALRMAQNCDVIVAAMGENVMLCGENRDRKGLHLPGRQEQFVERLLATGKPVVLVVFGGRAQVVAGIAERCAAIIQAWYPGEEGGNAVADILYGHVSPSGKLCVCYPNTELNEPICYNYSDKADSRVAWPFGFGLSYSSFEYSNLKMPITVETTADSFEISFDVKNVGSVQADEVAQLYVSPKSDENHKPIQLEGFARVGLVPGESKKVKIRLYTEQLGFFSHKEARQWNIYPGTFILKIAAASNDIRLQQEITLVGEKVVKPLRDHYLSDNI